MPFRQRAEAGMRRIQAKAGAVCRIPGEEQTIPCTTGSDADVISGDSGGLGMPDENTLSILKTDVADRMNKIALLETLEVPDPLETQTAPPVIDKWKTVQIKARHGLLDQSSPTITFTLGSPDE